MIALLHRFLADHRGVSAVEFALIAPVLILFYFGTVELNSALSANRKVTLAASTVADLVAQDDIIDAAEIDAVFTAAQAIMAPFDSEDAIQVRISSVRLNGQNEPAVVWSAGHNVAPRQTGSSVTMPAGLLFTGVAIVVAEVTFPYRSPVGRTLIGTINMDETFYLRPRRGNAVCRLTNNNQTIC